MRVSTSALTYSAATKSFVTEASTIAAGSGESLPPWIEVRSERTGAVKQFTFDRAMRDADNDVTAFIFKTQDGYQLHVLND